jgi:uncharacterized protein YkwD
MFWLITMQNRKLQMVLIRTGLLLLLTVQLFSCARPRPVPPDRIPARKPRPALSITMLEKQIHLLINRERRKLGLSPLAWDGALSRIARKHSKDMANRSYFSHNSPEGRDFSYRYGRDSYSCEVPVRETIYTGAENLFQNNRYDRVVYVNGETRYDWNTMRKIAESTVQGWMNSPGHRKNILTPHWRSEGIGVAIAPDDKIYITENFC